MNESSIRLNEGHRNVVRMPPPMKSQTQLELTLGETLSLISQTISLEQCPLCGTLLNPLASLREVQIKTNDMQLELFPNSV